MFRPIKAPVTLEIDSVVLTTIPPSRKNQESVSKYLSLVWTFTVPCRPARTDSRFAAITPLRSTAGAAARFAGGPTRFSGSIIRTAMAATEEQGGRASADRRIHPLMWGRFFSYGGRKIHKSVI